MKLDGHVADVTRVLEEIPHEPLDRQHARQLLVAVRLGQPHLFVARQLILGLARVEVHFIAESQQELVRLHESATIGRTTGLRAGRGSAARARRTA